MSEFCSPATSTCLAVAGSVGSILGSKGRGGDRGAPFWLPLILQKTSARLEVDRIDAMLERFCHRCFLLEARARIGVSAKQLEEHGQGFSATSLLWTAGRLERYSPLAMQEVGDAVEASQTFS